MSCCVNAVDINEIGNMKKFVEEMGKCGGGSGGFVELDGDNMIYRVKQGLLFYHLMVTMVKRLDLTAFLVVRQLFDSMVTRNLNELYVTKMVVKNKTKFKMSGKK